MTLSEMRLATIALGYVGLPLAVELGKQRPVVGYDIKASRVDLNYLPVGNVACL